MWTEIKHPSTSVKSSLFLRIATTFFNMVFKALEDLILPTGLRSLGHITPHASSAGPFSDSPRCQATSCYQVFAQLYPLPGIHLFLQNSSTAALTHQCSAQMSPLQQLLPQPQPQLGSRTPNPCRVLSQRSLLPSTFHNDK